MMSGSERGFEHIKVVKVQHSGDAEKQKKKKNKSGPMLLRTMNHKNDLLAFRESEEERELRIRKLFNFFDAANTGYLDKVKFETGLCALGKTAADCNKYAAELLKVCDMNSDGLVDYQDFQTYMDDKEIELYATFQAINVKRDGFISPQELREALVMAGIEINDKELGLVIELVDKDNNGTITFEKWRDFLLFYPQEATIENIYQYLDRACITDMGEQASIPEDISQDGNAFKFFLVGGIAGATSRTATAPLDRIKVALQVQTESALIVPAIKNIWKEGGFMGFFRGNGLNVLKVAPESAIKFYTYEILKNCFISDSGEDEGDIGTAERLIAGGMAGAVAQTAIYPLDFVKTRLQTYVCNVGIFPKVETLVKSIWIHEGPQAFYRGLIPSLLGVIPYAGIDFAAYELLKDMSKTHALQEDPGALVQLCCGTISGAVGASCVYPLQVIRTRMQAQYSGSSTAYTGMRDVIRRTLRCEGYRGFYRGFFLNLLKVVPSASITYLVYESMKKGLDL